MLTPAQLREIKERDFRYSYLPDGWIAQVDRRALLAEVERLTLEIKELTGVHEEES